MSCDGLWHERLYQKEDEREHLDSRSTKSLLYYTSTVYPILDMCA